MSSSTTQSTCSSEESPDTNVGPYSSLIATAKLYPDNILKKRSLIIEEERNRKKSFKTKQTLPQVVYGHDPMSQLNNVPTLGIKNQLEDKPHSGSSDVVNLKESSNTCLAYQHPPHHDYPLSNLPSSNHSKNPYENISSFMKHNESKLEQKFAETRPIQVPGDRRINNYEYGSDQLIHPSFSNGNKRDIVDLTKQPTGRMVFCRNAADNAKVQRVMQHGFDTYNHYDKEKNVSQGYATLHNLELLAQIERLKADHSKEMEMVTKKLMASVNDLKEQLSQQKILLEKSNTERDLLRMISEQLLTKLSNAKKEEKECSGITSPSSPLMFEGKNNGLPDTSQSQRYHDKNSINELSIKSHPSLIDRPIVDTKKASSQIWEELPFMKRNYITSENRDGETNTSSSNINSYHDKDDEDNDDDDDDKAETNKQLWEKARSMLLPPPPSTSNSDVFKNIEKKMTTLTSQKNNTVHHDFSRIINSSSHNSTKTLSDETFNLQW